MEESRDLHRKVVDAFLHLVQSRMRIVRKAERDGNWSQHGRGLSSQLWETRLAGYIGVFAERRRDFELALAIHTANAVDTMNSTLDEVHQK